MINQEEPEFKIESDFPLPANYSPSGKGGGKYPFRDMKVGDSFFVPGEKTGGTAHDRMKKYGKYHSKKFIARNMDGGVRMWRVK